MSRAAKDGPRCVDEVNVLGAQLKLDVLNQAHMSSVLCNDCACENVACGRCICPHEDQVCCPRFGTKTYGHAPTTEIISGYPT